jgi:hypothetical protein
VPDGFVDGVHVASVVGGVAAASDVGVAVGRLVV